MKRWIFVFALACSIILPGCTSNESLHDSFSASSSVTSAKPQTADTAFEEDNFVIHAQAESQTYDQGTAEFTSIAQYIEYNGCKYWITGYGGFSEYYDSDGNYLRHDLSVTEYSSISDYEEWYKTVKSLEKLGTVEGDFGILYKISDDYIVSENKLNADSYSELGGINLSDDIYSEFILWEKRG